MPGKAHANSRGLVAAVLMTAVGAGCSSRNARPLAERVVPCPATIHGLDALAARRPNLVIREDGERAIDRYHPGAARVFRLFDPDADPIAGNQCAYDHFGHLITQGPAAGTPDLVSPERSLLLHWLRDVRPFHRLGWREYHRQGWAPFGPSVPVEPPMAPGLPSPPSALAENSPEAPADPVASSSEHFRRR